MDQYTPASNSVPNCLLNLNLPADTFPPFQALQKQGHSRPSKSKRYMVYAIKSYQGKWQI